jgi:hypothetical protein
MLIKNIHIRMYIYVTYEILLVIYIVFNHNLFTFSGSFTNHLVPMLRESSESTDRFPVKSHTITDLSLEPAILY